MLTTNQSEAPGWPFPAKVVFTGFGEEHRQYAGSQPQRSFPTYHRPLGPTRPRIAE
jgi:hypothetical protein